MYKKFQAMEVAFGLDPEFFKKEFDVMVKERKAREGIILKQGRVVLDCNDGLNRVKQIWEKKDGQMLHKLIQLFIDSDFASVSGTQMRSLGINIYNFTMWDTNHNKYNVIEKISSGRYILRDEVITRLGLLQ